MRGTLVLQPSCAQHLAAVFSIQLPNPQSLGFHFCWDRVGYGPGTVPSIFLTLVSIKKTTIWLSDFRGSKQLCEMSMTMLWRRDRANHFRTLWANTAGMRRVTLNPDADGLQKSSFAVKTNNQVSRLWRWPTWKTQLPDSEREMVNIIVTVTVIVMIFIRSYLLSS